MTAAVAEVCEARIVLNGSPPVFDPSEFEFNVPEDGTYVGSATATDPDDDISEYILLGEDAVSFEIDYEGKITAVLDALDFESKQTHSFQVKVIDAYGNSDTAQVTVNVTDVAEDPVFGGGDLEFTISEMAHSNATVATIPLTDPQNDIMEIKVYYGEIDNPSTWVETDAFKASENNGQATLRVDDEWELDHESKPVWNLILKAIDVFGNSGTAGVEVTLTDEVEWSSTGISIATWHVALGYHHTEILIIPADQQAYENDGRFSQTVWVHRQEMVYATVGAVKQGFINPVLVSQVNRVSVDEDTWTQRGSVVTSGSTNDMIDLIFTLDAEYGDDLPYALSPGAHQFNSNSYTRGLLNALMAEDSSIAYSFVPGPAGAGDFLGWNKPVPLVEFGIDEEEE